MISDAAIRESIAMLAQLKTMNPPVKRGRPPSVLRERHSYVRSTEEQERMDQIKLQIEELERERSCREFH